MTLPDWAIDAPDHCLYASNASGVVELYTWDRSTGVTSQVTDRPDGTRIGALDPSGGWVWWFDDAGGNEFGVWRRQPFEGGSAQTAVVELPPSYPAGLALGRDGLAVVGRSTDDGTSVHLARPGSRPETV